VSSFTTEFFIKRKAASAAAPDVDPLAKWENMISNILAAHKFSQRFDQNTFEVSVVNSCQDRLSQGRPLSLAQKDLILKMYRRRGPVAFCGHRK
jgi:hypothetical protein